MLLVCLLQVVDSVSANPSVGFGFDIWKIIAVVEFILIMLLIFFRKKGNKNGMNSELLSAKSAEIDTDSMMSDIFKSKDLYEKLIRKCHPDRYLEEDMRQIMSELSKEITQNKSNYSVLCEIKDKIETLYNITI